MKLTINTSFPENSSSQHLLILVDAENIQTQYTINGLDQAIQATQFKASLNESLPLIGNIQQQANSALLGLDKAAELKPAKLAKIAQNIIKATQKKFKHISIDISALPVEHHYLFALALTQADYRYDQYKSKKAETILEHIDLIATKSTLDDAQIALIAAVEQGQSTARD